MLIAIVCDQVMVMAQDMGKFGIQTSLRMGTSFPGRFSSRILSLVCFGFFASAAWFHEAHAAQFTELRGQSRMGSAIALEAGVSDLDPNAESQLRTSCLSATWRPLNNAGGPSGPAMPISVNFAPSGPTSGLIRLNSRFALNEPVGQVTLRSNCPLTVFEVTWTLLAEEPLAKPMNPVPSVPVAPKRAVVAELDSPNYNAKINPQPPAYGLGAEKPKARFDVVPTRQNEFALGDIQMGQRQKPSDALAMSEKATRDEFVERKSSREDKAQVSKAASTSKEIESREKSKPVDQNEKQPVKSVAALESSEAKDVSKTSQNFDELASKSAEVDNAPSVSDKIAPQTMATANGDAQQAVEGNLQAGDELAQLDERLMSANMVPSQVNTASDVVPAIPVEVHEGNVMFGIMNGVSPMLMAAFGLSVLLLSGGVWFVFRKPKSNAVKTVKTHLDRGDPVLKGMSDALRSPLATKVNARVESPIWDDEKELKKQQDVEEVAAVAKSSRKTSKFNPNSVFSDEESNAVATSVTEPMSELAKATTEVNAIGNEKIKSKKKGKSAEKTEVEQDSVRLMQSFLGADVPVEAVAPVEPKRPIIGPAPERADDGAREERLAEGVAQVKRAHMSQWHLPESYQPLVEERNRNLAHSSSDAALTIRAHLGLLELAYLEAKEGQMLESKWAMNLLNKLLGKKRIDAEKTLGSDVPDVILSFLTMRAYEISDPNCRAVFKSNCLMLAKGLKPHHLCFTGPAWSAAVDAAFPELQTA